MTSRTQITVDPELARLARARAKARGVSFAEYVRRLIENDVREESGKGDVSSIFGLGNSGGTNIGKDKHKLVGEAFAVLDLDRHKKP